MDLFPNVHEAKSAGRLHQWIVNLAQDGGRPCDNLQTAFIDAHPLNFATTLLLEGEIEEQEIAKLLRWGREEEDEEGLTAMLCSKGSHGGPQPTIKSMRETGGTNAIEIDCSLCDLLVPPFLTEVIQKKRLSAFSVHARADHTNTVAILPSRNLVLALDKDTFELMGLPAAPCPLSRGRQKDLVHCYLSTISLAADSFRPGNKIFERVQWVLRERIGPIRLAMVCAEEEDGSKNPYSLLASPFIPSNARVTSMSSTASICTMHDCRMPFLHPDLSLHRPDGESIEAGERKEDGSGDSGDDQGQQKIHEEERTGRKRKRMREQQISRIEAEDDVEWQVESIEEYMGGLHEWLGLLLCGCDTLLKQMGEGAINDYLCAATLPSACFPPVSLSKQYRPLSKSSLPTSSITRVSLSGMLSSTHISSIYDRLHRVVTEGRVGWACIHVTGFRDSPVSFKEGHHGFDLNGGENDYTLVLLPKGLKGVAYASLGALDTAFHGGTRKRKKKR